MKAASSLSPNVLDGHEPLKSLGRPSHAVIVGASGGIGRAFVEALAQIQSVVRVHALSRTLPKLSAPKTLNGVIDLEDEHTIASAAEEIAEHSGKINLIIVATGILHDGAAFQPEKSWRALRTDQLERAFKINTIGPLLVSRHFLPLLDRDAKSVFAVLSARVGSIKDNRLGGWYGYRASKAALNMSVRNLSVELGRTHPHAICLSLHPGTVDTGLSKPFQRGVKEAQLQSPASCAAKLLSVIDSATPDDSGGFFAYDGTRLPF